MYAAGLADEQEMQRFKSAGSARKFPSTCAAVHSTPPHIDPNASHLSGGGVEYLARVSRSCLKLGEA
jgi:hypothetical protein